MTRISLIANSSIQYYKFSSLITSDFGKENRLYFHQPFESEFLDFIYNPLLKTVIDDQEVYYIRHEIIDRNALISSTNKIKHDADLNGLTMIPDRDVHVISNIKTALKKFKNKWVPVPYYKNNQINHNLKHPTDWVRVYIDCNDDYTEAELVIAVDTTLAKSSQDTTSPQMSLNADENIFSLANDENIINEMFYSEDSTLHWIEEYIGDSFYGKNEELRSEQPYKQYIGYYILLIKWLSSLKNTPEIQLYSDTAKKIPVDLVIDIGNSATCALLFENDSDTTFRFDKVKKLTIQDYSDPRKEYEKPFPMNLIFKQAHFGELRQDNYHNNKFAIPSFVRIGYEAEHLIHDLSINLELGRELNSYNSSPKRYLWDENPAEIEWENAPGADKIIRRVHLGGISEQLKSDGTLTRPGEVFGSKALYSRSSLMKFVFLEIFTHAYIQINSYRFREEHGNLTTPRTLKRVTISCPTAMIQHEQIALRKAAEEACSLLNRYFAFTTDVEDILFEAPEIIPSINDLKKDLSNLEERKDWTYDEATSCQLVFLYSLLSKKLHGNHYVLKNYIYKKKEQLKIGAIDIGAGTTDVMIASYPLSYKDKIIELNPTPLYWDSFKLAGDDLLKQLVQKIIIQGQIEHSFDEGCAGVLENYAKSKGIEDIYSKLNGFFGQDSNKIGFVGKLMRKAFVQQVAIPIIYHYLDQANSGITSYKTFEEIIDKEFKNKELIKYFHKHFGFDFLSIRWTIEPKKVEQIVKAVFDSSARQFGMLFNTYNCDYIVLSGKPANLNCLEALFIKYLEIDRPNIINLNKYWIGKWYPFSDHNGYVEDAKTAVAVGSMISLMSNKERKLNDLSFNIEQIKQKLISTADYIVKKDFDSKQILLSPKDSEAVLKVSQLPYSFGYSQLPIADYPVSDLYSISLDFQELLHTYQFDEDQANKKRMSMLQNLPLRISITRDFDLSKEQLKIDSVEDSEGNDLPKRYFKLSYQTLGDQQEYWLDNCEFTLAITS